MSVFGNIDFNFLNNGNNPFGFVAQNLIIKPEMLNFNVPLVQKQYAAPAQQLTAEGNVPVGGASGSAVENPKGTTVEITSDVKKTEEAKQIEDAKKAEEEKKAQQARKEEQEKIDEKNRAKMADKRDINTVMKLTLKNKDWDKLSEEEKQKEIIKFLETSPEKDFKYVGGRIGWLKSFMTNNKNMDAEETRLIVGSLKYLKVSDKQLAQLQADGVNLTADKKAVNKFTAQTQVVKDSDKYCVEGQKASIDVTTASEYDDVKIAISQKISDLDESLHLYGVQKSLEGSKTSSEDVQKQIGYNLVDQYGKYAKSAQAEIHKTISGSNIPAIKDYANANVSKISSTNNTSNPPITVTTTTSVADKTAVTETPTTPPANNSSGRVVNVSESEARVNTVKNLINSNKTGNELITAVKNLSDLEKISLIRQNAGNLDLIRAIFTNNPSIAVLNEISKVIKNNENISKQMSNSSSMRANVGFLGIEAQLAFVDNVKNLNAVDIKMLCPTAQARYNARIQEENRVTNKG